MSMFLEIKERGATDASTLSKVLKIKIGTVMSCLEELKSKDYLQEMGDVWITSSDTAPDKSKFEMVGGRSEGWNLEAPKIPSDDNDDIISDALLESLESTGL